MKLPSKIFTSRSADLQRFYTVPVPVASTQKKITYTNLLPSLPVVPSNQDLKIKASSSGIVFLKDGKFRTRYTGNKFSKVDIEGHLWLEASGLRLPAKQKKTRVETQVGKKLSQCVMQISDNLSTLENENTGVINNLPTVEKKKKSYRVHKREVRQRLLGYLNTMNGKKELYFWTVTFPMGTTDAKAYQIFNIWLTSLRKHKMLKNYLWVAERQGEKSTVGNTTLHFHIAIPHKMPVQRANAMMRGTLKTFSKRGEIPYSTYQCAKYNGVDIAKNRDTKRVTNFAIKKGSRALVGYLTKYVTKNDSDFEHLAWHNSRGYSSIFTGVTFTVPEFRSNGLYLLLDAKKRFEAEFFVFVPWFGEPPKKLMEHLYILNSFIQAQLN